MERLTFTVDAKLLRELGERLVGRPHIALAELIKNSYDADARSVVITFAEDLLRIVDDGHGMTRETFTERWMRIGTTAKVGQRISPGQLRTLTGSKGVGRLSVQLLAQRLRLRSVALRDVTTQTLERRTSLRDAELSREISANIVWPDELKKRHLTEVGVDFSTAKPKLALLRHPATVPEQVRERVEQRDVTRGEGSRLGGHEVALLVGEAGHGRERGPIGEQATQLVGGLAVDPPGLHLGSEGVVGSDPLPQLLDLGLAQLAVDGTPGLARVHAAVVAAREVRVDAAEHVLEAFLRRREQLDDPLGDEVSEDVDELAGEDLPGVVVGPPGERATLQPLDGPRGDDVVLAVPPQRQVRRGRHQPGDVIRQGLLPQGTALISARRRSSLRPGRTPGRRVSHVAETTAVSPSAGST